MAGPRKKIDPEQVVKLGRLGCTTAEIADILGCSPDTLERRFAGELAQARANRKMSLRRAQTIRATRDRSDTMLIHLGKCELGQAEAQEPEARLTRDQLVEIIKASKAATQRADEPGGDRPGALPVPEGPGPVQ